MLNQANAEELAKIASETGALVLHGQLRYPGPDSGDWEIGMDSVPDALYPLRDRLALLILAAVDGEALDLCGLRFCFERAWGALPALRAGGRGRGGGIGWPAGGGRG